MKQSKILQIITYNSQKRYSGNMHMLNNNIFNNSGFVNILQNNKIFKLKNYNALKDQRELIGQGQEEKICPINTNFHYNNDLREKNRLRFASTDKSKQIHHLPKNYSTNNINDQKFNHQPYSQKEDNEKEKSFAEYMEQLSLKYSKPKRNNTLNNNNDLLPDCKTSIAIKKGNVNSTNDLHSVNNGIKIEHIHNINIAPKNDNDIKLKSVHQHSQNEMNNIGLKI